MSISSPSDKTKAFTMRALAIGVMMICVSAQAAKTTPEDFGIELQNKVTAEVLVAARLLPDGRVEYAYSVKSSTLSLQDILRFHLQTQVTVAEAALVAAPGWFVGSAGTKESLEDGSIKEFVSWIGEDIPTLIKPGHSLAGFKLTGKSFPGIQDFQIQGYTDKDMAKMDLFEEEMDVLSDLQDPFKGNSFKGKTIGPDPVPEVINLAGLVERLIALKHQAASLGWIFGPGSDGIVTSLDAKLDAAKASIARGQNNAASNQLSAFISELNAQRGKKLNDNAFFLLKVNAEFIIGKLGS